MKMQLHFVYASNLDIAFRFGISATTVDQEFTRWIEAMDAQSHFGPNKKFAEDNAILI